MYAELSSHRRLSKQRSHRPSRQRGIVILRFFVSVVSATDPENLPRHTFSTIRRLARNVLLVHQAIAVEQEWAKSESRALSWR